MKTFQGNVGPSRSIAHQNRKGATIVEFAMVAPIFFLLVFAGLEFAVLGTIRSTAQNAAYEGARNLVIPGAVAQTGIDEATRIMSIVGVDTLTVTVNPTVIDDNTKQVTVNVSVPYASNAIFTPFFTGSVTVNTSVTMATERYSGMVANP